MDQINETGNKALGRITRLSEELPFFFKGGNEIT